MKTTVTAANRQDAFDVEQFRDMLALAAFRRFLDRVQADFQRAVDTCVAHDDELAIRRAQGAAAALRMVLGLPDQMLTEIKNAVKR